MKLALSPCPNDTALLYGALFEPTVKGKTSYFSENEVVLADIEQLNEWALKGTHPITKLSFACLAQVLDIYELLPVGAALGHGCGPKIIAKARFSLDELSEKTIAIPGLHTTAHLLLDRFFPGSKKKRFCLYHEVEQMLEKEEVECALIIHETRFTFSKRGFCELVDLGELWEKQTGYPLPLGAFAIKRTLPKPIKQGIASLLKASYDFLHSHPEKPLPFILRHSQEKDPAIVREHIHTYVNEETRTLSETGKKAISTLLSLADEGTL